jgi:hypothetical protein
MFKVFLCFFVAVLAQKSLARVFHHAEFEKELNGTLPDFNSTVPPTNQSFLVFSSLMDPSLNSTRLSLISIISHHTVLKNQHLKPHGSKVPNNYVTANDQLNKQKRRRMMQ